ncbi:MAG: site-specific integrase [Acetobacteraceae bacterium]|nr:site-specific integrase [Acetobacteraceae bacterium]
MSKPSISTSANSDDTADLNLTFADVLRAVDAAIGLPDGSRDNLRNAVRRTASLLGAQGLHTPVNIPALRKRLEKVTAAKLGFQSEGSFASFRSNLNRALRLAGVQVMPGKSHAPLTYQWGILRERAEVAGLWPALSRFAHWCSERGVAPEDVGTDHLRAFGELMRTTCLRSRADKAVPQVAKAWRKAQAEVSGWPQQVLPVPEPRRADSSPPWSAYPPSLEADARNFVSGGTQAGDWLEGDGAPQRRAATQVNYLGALRRAAGELVAAGIPPEQLCSLADLVQPDRVRMVLQRTAERTGRRRGGHVSLLATVLLLAGRDHVRLPPEAVRRLERMQSATLPERTMGDRTLERLMPFEDGAKLDALIGLPRRLAAMAKRHGKVDIQSARLVRCALFLQLLLDTGARQGNIVALDLNAHLLLGPRDHGTIIIPGELVKNGEEVRAPLRPETVRLLRLYLETYRPVHAGATPSRWLFPRPDGSHWPTTAAGQTLIELAARHVGADVNPHLVRALLGMLILAEQPGGTGLVSRDNQDENGPAIRMRIAAVVP